MKQNSGKNFARSIALDYSCKDIFVGYVWDKDPSDDPIPQRDRETDLLKMYEPFCLRKSNRLGKPKPKQKNNNVDEVTCNVYGELLFEETVFVRYGIPKDVMKNGLPDTEFSPMCSFLLPSSFAF